MGYRSNVLAVFYSQRVNKDDATPEDDARNKAVLDMFVRENFPESTQTFGDLRRLEQRGRVLWEFYASDAKWYESYFEVRDFEKFWDKFLDLANGEVEAGDEPVFWACEFARIGENHDDAEHKGSIDSEWLINIRRSIETEY